MLSEVNTGEVQKSKGVLVESEESETRGEDEGRTVEGVKKGLGAVGEREVDASDAVYEGVGNVGGLYDIGNGRGLYVGGVLLLCACRKPKDRDDSGRKLNFSGDSGRGGEVLEESPTNENLRLVLAMTWADEAGSGIHTGCQSWGP